MSAGRPSGYSPEIVSAICQKLADGLSLREICSHDEMPSQSMVFRWLAEHAEFREKYARAREAQAEYWADEIVEISDDGSNDWLERRRQDGSTETVLDHEHVTRSKLRVDSRKWLLSKLLPKKYGDKVALTGGTPEDAPIRLERIEYVIIDPKDSNS